MRAERAVTAPQGMATGSQSSEEELQGALQCSVCCGKDGTSTEAGAFHAVSNIGRRTVMCSDCIGAFAGSYGRNGEAPSE